MGGGDGSCSGCHHHLSIHAPLSWPRCASLAVDQEQRGMEGKGGRGVCMGGDEDEDDNDVVDDVGMVVYHRSKARPFTPALPPWGPGLGPSP